MHNLKVLTSQRETIWVIKSLREHIELIRSHYAVYRVNVSICVWKICENYKSILLTQYVF